MEDVNNEVETESERGSSSMASHVEFNLDQLSIEGDDSGDSQSEAILGDQQQQHSLPNETLSSTVSSVQNVRSGDIYATASSELELTEELNLERNRTDNLQYDNNGNVSEVCEARQSELSNYEDLKFDRTYSVPSYVGVNSSNRKVELTNNVDEKGKEQQSIGCMDSSNCENETVSELNRAASVGASDVNCNSSSGNSSNSVISNSITHNKKQLPWDRMHQWIYCIAVVTFDVELGQTIEHIYPPHISLEGRERSNVCFLSFPDSNSGCMGDTVYSFRIRHTSKHMRTLTNAQKHHFNVYAINKYQGFQDYLYGAVHFRQLKDTSIKRGYFQKSVVVLSPLPFVSLWLEVVSVIGEDFFRNGELSLEVACHSIDQWPYPSPGAQLQLPMMGNVFEVTLPHQGQMSAHVSRNGFSHLGRTAPGSRVGEEGGGERRRLFRGDERISRVLGSVVDLDLYACFHSLLPHIQLIWELVLLGQPIVVMGPSPDITSRMVYILTSIIYPFKWGSDYRPYFTIHDSEFKEFTLAPSSYSPATITNNSSTTSISSSPRNTGASDSGSQSMTAQHSQTTSAHIPRSNKNNSSAALSSTHSQSSHNATYPQIPPKVILGVTNPFFAKTLAHWPNLIRIGDLDRAGSATSGGDPSNGGKLDSGSSRGGSASFKASSSSSPSTSFHSSYRPHSSTSSSKSIKVIKASKNSVKVLDSKPGVFTNHKLYLEKDRTMVKRLVRGREQHKPPEVLSSWIRKFFRELTESFSIPLEHYLSTLMPLAKTVCPWRESPQLKPFVASDFLKHIERAGPQLTSGLKGDWVGLYRQFLSSHNFGCWLLSRRTEINQRLQLVHLDAISQANLEEWLDGKSEVEAVDLLIKLKEKLRRLSAADRMPTRLEIDENVYRRIYDMMQLIVEKLPQDLKQSLLNNSLLATAHSLSNPGSAQNSGGPSHPGSLSRGGGDGTNPNSPQHHQGVATPT
ncbi:protein DENND6A-like isoform X2 [Convolutriloba macropyga]|uniref:protein DENND6A-like isoform X2 n=1 Tax=Convolutriloba macropyga TaxID=536237 RepID=UPI003F527985